MLQFLSGFRSMNFISHIFKKFSSILSGIGGRLMVILLVTTLGFIAIGVVTYLTTTDVNKRWGYFRDNVAERVKLLEDIRQHVGYGGIIHQFKNAVLRKEKKYLLRFDKIYTVFKKTVKAYAQLDLSTKERQLLKKMTDTFNNYYNFRYDVLEGVMESSETSESIDYQVKVNDTPALQAMTELNQIVERLENEQTQLLEHHLAQMQQLMLTVMLVTMLLVIIVTYLTARLVLNSLRQASQVANNIAAGHLDNTIIGHNRDEIGLLFNALALMQTQLHDQITKEKRIAQAALRINRALDSVTTSVVIADENYKIIYTNSAAQTLFQTHNNTLQQHLPNWSDHQSLTSQELAVFYANSEQNYRRLSDLSSSFYSQLEVAELSLEYTATPVFDQQGERIGIVKEFHDHTEQVKTRSEINRVIEAASTGDFSQRIDLADKTGFFRSFSAGLNQVMGYNQQVVRDVMAVFSALAQGNLACGITNDYQGEFEQLKNDANLTIRKLTETLDVIQQIADIVNEAADNLSNNSVDLSQRAEQQAASLQETAASIEQMNATVQQSTENVRHARQITAQVAEQANHASEGVQQAVTAMQTIRESSRQVSNIISVIDDIAFQTNLLALNAAVEAARAGEQGRGFAVVANEVRHLAQRSAVSAKEIKTLIGDSVNKIAEGTGLVNELGEMLTEMLTGVQQVNEFMTDIASASQDQAMGIQQVTRAITQMETMTQQSTHLVQQTATASSDMAKQAQRLRKRVAFFTLETSLKPSFSSLPNST